MIAILNESILWWHWIVLGIVLLILEMSTGTFIMLGLGLAAIIAGVIDVFFSTSFTIELSIWMFFSVLTIAIWYQWFRMPTVSHTGQSNYTLDTLGTLSDDIAPGKRAKVIFDSPVLGTSSWQATAKTHIAKDSRVAIVEVNGQLIEVKNI